MDSYKNTYNNNSTQSIHKCNQVKPGYSNSSNNNSDNQYYNNTNNTNDGGVITNNGLSFVSY